MSETAEMPATEPGSMIVRTPRILGGKPHVRGHRVGVHRVAGWWKRGLSVEQERTECRQLERQQPPNACGRFS